MARIFRFGIWILQTTSQYDQLIWLCSTCGVEANWRIHLNYRGASKFPERLLFWFGGCYMIGYQQKPTLKGETSKQQLMIHYVYVWFRVTIHRTCVHLGQTWVMLLNEMFR